MVAKRLFSLASNPPCGPVVGAKFKRGPQVSDPRAQSGLGASIEFNGSPNQSYVRFNQFHTLPVGLIVPVNLAGVSSKGGLIEFFWHRSSVPNDEKSCCQ